MLAQLVEHLIAAGVHGLTPLGSTGEFAYLGARAEARDRRGGGGGGARSRPGDRRRRRHHHREGASLARAVTACGADGVLAVLEAYFPLADAGVEDYFRAVAEATPGPVVLYTNPQFQRSDLSLPVIARLSSVPNIRYIKDASTNTGRLMSIMTATEGRMGVFAASAHIPLCVMMIGGRGWMAGPACVVPRQSVRLYELATAGAWAEAMALQRELWALNEVFARFGLAACIKAALEVQGFAVGDPLPPQTRLNESDRAALRAVLALNDALAPS